jgi:hypothetical protein
LSEAYDDTDNPMGAHARPRAQPSDLGIGLGWAELQKLHSWAQFPQPSPAHLEPWNGSFSSHTTAQTDRRYIEEKSDEREQFDITARTSSESG